VPKPDPAKSAHEVAKLLDDLIRPRFQEDAGRFGVMRVDIIGHQNVENGDELTPKEKRLAKTLKRAKRDYVVGFSHLPHSKGVFVRRKHPDPDETTSVSISEGRPFATLYAQVKGRVTETDDPVLHRWEDQHFRTFKAIVKSKIRRLNRGKSQEVTQGDWLVVMKPISADKPACLSCHNGAKRGDTLGAMIYIVRTSLNK